MVNSMAGPALSKVKFENIPYTLEELILNSSNFISWPCCGVPLLLTQDFSKLKLGRIRIPIMGSDRKWSWGGHLMWSADDAWC